MKIGLYILFLLGLAVGCYRHPVPDEFDRYMYEAIVRGKSQPIEVVYETVRHENQRTESSSNLESIELLREFEPLWAIRPLYIDAVWLVSYLIPIQNAISFISAVSLFGIGIVVLRWTRMPLLSALLMASYPVVLLGRFGTPDSLSALLSLTALWLTAEDISFQTAIAILFLSLGIRTDNVLLLIALLCWLLSEHRIRHFAAFALAIGAIGVVLAINKGASNYGWAVLFRLSLIGGRHPAQMPHEVSVGEYVRALVHGTSIIMPHITVWLLLAIAAYRRASLQRVLVVVGLAVFVHFLLYPSGDDRYLSWAYIVSAVAFIRSFDLPRTNTPAAKFTPKHDTISA